MTIINQKLSNNFWLSELTKSETALRLDIDNWPTEQIIVDKLTLLLHNIVQPARDHFGIPFAPGSGYRCLLLNRALKSKDTSQHLKGEAADIEISSIPNYDLAAWIESNCEFDQLILEFYTPGQPTSGWVHVSYVDTSVNRKQSLTINKSGVSMGLLK